MSDSDIQRYQQMLAEDPRSRAFAPLAEAHRKAGRLDEAIRVARAGLEIHPAYSGGLVVLGRALYEKGELDNAAEVLQGAVTETPESYLGQKFLGKVLVDKGEYQGAIKALEAANMLSPEDEEVVRLLDELRSRITAPPTIEYQSKQEPESDPSQIVTYDQKPTTVDGVELPPLPVESQGETYSFSEEEGEAPREAAAVPVADETDQEEMTATVVEDVEVEQTMDIGSLEDLDPEVAAFIEEGGAVDQDSVEEMEIEYAAEEMAEDVVEFHDFDIETATEGPEEGPFRAEEPGVQAAVASTPGQPASEPAGSAAPPSGGPGSASFGEPSPEVSEGTGRHSASGSGPHDAGDSAPDPLAAGFARPVPEHPFQAPSPAGEGAAPAPPAGGPQEAGVSLPAAEEAGSLPDPEGRPVAAEDQFSTETMADLYAQQGMVDKAIEIYRRILAQAPGNEAVRLKLSALESAPRQEEQVRESEAPSGSEPQETGGGAAGDDDILRALEGMLSNVERMKRP